MASSAINLDDCIPSISSDVSDDIATELECPICVANMSSPIYLCTGGHSVCGNCVVRMTKCPTCERPFTGARNYTLERVSSKVKLQCVFSFRGCDEVLQITPKKRHEKVCKHRDFKCLASALCTAQCNWNGPRSHMVDHFAEMHPGMMLFPNASLINWKLGTKNIDIKCIDLFGESFFLVRNLVVPSTVGETFLCFRMLHLKSEKQSKSFSWEISFQGLTLPRQQFQVKLSCSDELKYIESGNVDTLEAFDLCLPLRCLQKFMLPNNQISYTIAITEPEAGVAYFVNYNSVTPTACVHKQNSRLNLLSSLGKF